MAKDSIIITSALPYANGELHLGHIVSTYSPADILGTIYNVSKSLDISDEIKLPILKEIGFAQLRVSEGLSTLCQLVSLIGYLCKIKPK